MGEAGVVEVTLLDELADRPFGHVGRHPLGREVRAHLDLGPIPVPEEPIGEPERALERLGRPVGRAVGQAAFSSGSGVCASASALASTSLAGRSSPSIGLTRSRSSPSASYTLASISFATSALSSR